MKLWFLPFVREGLLPEAESGARATADLRLELTSSGRPARDVTRRSELLGPGDVLAIDGRQILRMTPAPGSRDAECDFFPSLELDAPDLPWAYSPARPDGRKLNPWMCLIVIEDQPGVSIAPGDRGQSPFILRLPADVARRELPDLADAWAWAHAQVACDEGQIAETLKTQPDQTLARLISPRRLLPRRRYHACLVPTYRAGVAAGLGSAPHGDQAPAWTASDLPGELPVYHRWSFTTGEAGDFESLARRLKPAPLDAQMAAAQMHLKLPRPVEPPTVDWRAPLRVLGTPTASPPPSEVADQIRESLAPSGGEPPVFGPSFLGASWRSDQLRLTPPDVWPPELNLSPMWRAAAGLGAEVVRKEQDAIVDAVAAQLEEQRKNQRQRRREQLATAVDNRLKQRLSAAPQSEAARVLAPKLSRTPGASDLGLFSTAGRRITRKSWRARAIPPHVGGAITHATVTAPAGGLPLAATPAHAAAPALPGMAVPPIPMPGHSLVTDEVRYPTGPHRPPLATATLPLDTVDPRATGDVAFALRIDRPLSEPLARRFPELMLPASGRIPDDSALLVETEPAFVAAFLVGANQELNRELLWRGLLADQTATAFRRFWSGIAVDEIADIASWRPSTSLTSQAAASSAMVLLLRGELVRRHPTMIIAAVPATWESATRRLPVATSTQLVPPSFRGRIGDDVLYAGFPTPSVTEALGTPDPSGPAGWFFMLAENPGDPRFGLDPDGPAAPTRDTLAWTHLSQPAGASYADVDAFPNVSDAGYVAANTSSAKLASLLWQRPFRAFLHASLLVRS